MQMNWEEELRSIAEYLGCNEGELVSEGMQLIRKVEQAAREDERVRCADIARSGVIAQGWTTERNEKKEMDIELAVDCAEAIARAIESDTMNPEAMNKYKR